MYLTEIHTSYIHHTYHIWIGVNPYVYVLYVLKMYLNVSMCISLLYCMYCMYFLPQNLLGGRYIQDTYNTYTYAHDTYRYNFNTYKIHTKYMQIHTAKLVAQKVHIACISMYLHVSFFNPYVHVCVCMICMCMYVYVS